MSEQSAKAKRLLSARATCGIALALIFAGALALRVSLPYDNVFPGDWVRFRGYDSWYHMRLVENLLHHFPHRIAFDPFTYYPHGQDVFFAPLYDLLLGLLAWIVGLGSPSKGLTDTLGAYLPAVLGALVTVPVYLIAKEIFNRKVGLMAAALVAILPSEFLSRSLLGNADHHVAETLLSSFAVLFLIKALRSSRQEGISFHSLRTGEWRKLKRPALYSLATGVALGLYLLSWVGGAVMVFVIVVYAFLQYIIDHMKGRSTDYLCMVGIPFLLVALLMVLPFRGQFGMEELHVASLVAAMLMILAMSALSWLMARQGMRRVYYPVAVTILAIIGVAACYLVAPSLFSTVLSKFSALGQSAGALTIGEVGPLTLSMAWQQFTTCFYVALISLAILAYAVFKKGSPGKTLLLVWSLTMLGATFAQNRFTYYFTVNVAILTAYFCWKVLEFVVNQRRASVAASGDDGGGKKLKGSPRGVKPAKQAKGKKAAAGKAGTGARGLRGRVPGPVLSGVAIAVVFFLAFFPNIQPAIHRASAIIEPDDDWHSTLVWMKDNTPDPFPNADFYYQLYEKPPAGTEYDYPESAYGVMSLWDYGHWITEIAHRIPNSNPHQAGAVETARFFTAQDEASANEILDELGSRYVIVDVDMATAFARVDGKLQTGKFYAFPVWAGKDEDEFYETYYVRNQGSLQPVILFYPEYYQSMCVRLYTFGGNEVVPANSTSVVSYVQRDGYKEISSAKSFPTYEEASEYLASQTTPNYRMVGRDPMISPVPLDRLEHYQLVHHSDSWGQKVGDEIKAYKVEVFQYSP